MNSAARLAYLSHLAVLALSLLGAAAASAQTVQPAPLMQPAPAVQPAPPISRPAMIAPPAPAALAPSAEYVEAQARWKTDLTAFAAADKERLPGDHGVLFVGSSTIRLWASMAKDFSQLPVVINRGFGGSMMYDLSLFARDLVVRYKPRQVLVYAGDNDLAGGRTPMQVLEAFGTFTATVREELPDVRITYISVKPSPSRENLLPKIRETNDIIAAYLKRVPNSEYIDIFTPMMQADGKPRPELFRDDRLHLNAEGYKLWQSIIVSHLPTVTALPEAMAQAEARRK